MVTTPIREDSRLMESAAVSTVALIALAVRVLPRVAGPHVSSNGSKRR
jgi:hypothetical protein